MKEYLIKFVIIILSVVSLIFVGKNIYCDDEQSEKKVRIAVFDLETQSGISKSDALAISDTLRAEIVKTEAFEVIQRKQLEKILQEAKFQVAGLTSEEDKNHRVELGKLLNVNMAIIGSINNVFDKISINIFMIDLVSGKNIMAETETCSKDMVFEKIKEIAGEISYKITGKNTPNAENLTENNIKKEPEKELKTEQSALPNLCPDGNFDSREIVTTEEYNHYRSDLEGKWQLITFKSDALATVNNNQCHIKLRSRGMKSWMIKLGMMPFKLEYGKFYRLTFDARSLSERKIDVGFQKIGGDWIGYGWGVFYLYADMQTYSFQFTMKKPTTDIARLVFDLAGDMGEVWIANVRVEEVQY